MLRKSYTVRLQWSRRLESGPEAPAHQSDRILDRSISTTRVGFTSRLRNLEVTKQIHDSFPVQRGNSKGKLISWDYFNMGGTTKSKVLLTRVENMVPQTKVKGARRADVLYGIKFGWLHATSGHPSSGRAAYVKKT